HAENGEFREVAEIAEAPAITVHNLPYVALFYSKFFRIREEDDCDSITFLKWRCVLDSSIDGHVDDFLEFPTKELLKIHALKHFETHHQDFYSSEYFQYEKALLQQELPTATDVYSYSPLTWSFDKEPFDTTYVASVFGAAIPRNSPFTLLATDILTSDPETIDSERLLPNNILGPVGREALRRLKGGDDSAKAASPAAHNEERSGSPHASSANLETDVHPVEIFVPRSECSSADITRTDEHSMTGCTEGSTIDEVDFTNTPEKEEPLFNSLVTPKGEGVQAGDSATIRIAESTSEPSSVVNSSPTAPTNNELDVPPPIQGPDNIDVQEHKLIIHRKFQWEGPPPPPLDAEQTQQLVCLARNECPFCTTARGPRGLRIPQFANDEIKEESMLAHVVKFHYKDPAAKWVLNAKR
ncbi:hypothetical protein OSTOST_24716, partial [Ostertagia ostertagi]